MLVCGLSFLLLLLDDASILMPLLARASHWNSWIASRRKRASKDILYGFGHSNAMATIPRREGTFY